MNIEHFILFLYLQLKVLFLYQHLIFTALLFVVTIFVALLVIKSVSVDPILKMDFTNTNYNTTERSTSWKYTYCLSTCDQRTYWLGCYCCCRHPHHLYYCFGGVVERRCNCLDCQLRRPPLRLIN